ncbi:MFS transporter [Pacificibacter marinus]|uniref:Vacuole effluxer Atg22 like protein n=1 Tax=Pacificibacter marinus TaxID=658057 RepID=A0A1Y5S1V0_9RHOB|nr:MFS transporter [Pacificibacter marinus]SEK93927.1 MFS transporter, UMF1 family [Pacificibacter marinus]SLN30180.1 Vacuole effluxer Atg22 like protein [Pacificibacter marinus]
MKNVSASKRIKGWMMYDWASQPYHTLIVTFIFGPYFAEQVIAHFSAMGVDHDTARAQAQSVWGLGLTISGLSIAILAPVLGAIADGTERRLPWIWVFSACYIVGAAGLWFASPTDFPTYMVLAFFILGMIGVEFTTIFTNAILPSLGDKSEIGKVSGNGWAWGYVGGVLALILMLLFFAENSNGITLLGKGPLFGLDPEMREGTRFVGPFVAGWFALSMIPFFLWMREPRGSGMKPAMAIKSGLSSLLETLKSLPSRKSLLAYLMSSMFYRDSLNGVFAFGGVYALGVLEWSVINVGVFGILAALSGAIFTYIGGFQDKKFGPKPVIVFSIVLLIVICVSIISITPESVLLIPVAAQSSMPDVAFYVCGIALGAVGGVIQSASRTMMVRQADPERMTEAFGLYALSGKATSFLAPALIAVATALTNSQRMGITPLIGLFLVGLILLAWVKPDGEEVS